MKTIGKITTIMMLALFLAGTSVNAQPCMRGGEKHMDRMKEMLGLNDDQQAKIEKLHNDLMKENLKLKSQLKEKKAHLTTLEIADKADMGAINRTIDEISALKTQMAKNRAKHHQDVRSLLTPEQRVKFDTHYMQRANNRGGKHGNGPGMGYGPGGGKYGQGDCPYRGKPGLVPAPDDVDKD